MMMNDTKNEFLSRIRARAGGNSDRGLKEVASDLINNLGLKDSEVATMTFMAPSTIARLRELTPTETGADYRPQAETIERVFRACGAEISLNAVKINKKYQNKPKEEE